MTDKAYFQEKQQLYAEKMFIKDGCPPEDAKKENWASMVKNLYDGDDDGALREFSDALRHSLISGKPL